MAGAKTYKGRHTVPTRIDRERLEKVAECVYPALADELAYSIAERASYSRIRGERGKIGLNRSDFYGYRRKIVDAYVEGGV